MMSQVQNADRFGPAHARALFAIGLLLTGALLDLLGVALHLLMLLRAGPFSQTAEDVADLEGVTNVGDVLIGLLGLVKAFVYVSIIVAFLVWLHRAYKNLRAFAPKTDFSPGWAVGNWFIPFGNLVLPYRAVKELWIKSDPAVDFSAGFARAGDGARNTFIVGIWWFFWIVSNVAGQVYFRLTTGETGAHSDAAASAGVASNALTLFAALLAAAVVRTIDRMQTEKSQRLGLNLWSPPPAPPSSFDDAGAGARP